MKKILLGIVLLSAFATMSAIDTCFVYSVNETSQKEPKKYIELVNSHVSMVENLSHKSDIMDIYTTYDATDGDFYYYTSVVNYVNDFRDKEIKERIYETAYSIETKTLYSFEKQN